MSDYISKSEFIETLKNPPLHCSLGGIIIEDILVMVEEQPLVDEKEIIRKAFERVVERLEELKANSFDDEVVVMNDAIEIVKEECGINE